MENLTEELNVRLEFTPNPNTLKYSVNREFLKRGAENYLNEDQAKSSPLAHKLFYIQGVLGVMIGTNFVTLTIDESADIEVLNEQAIRTIQTHLSSGGEIFKNRTETTFKLDGLSARDQEIVKRIHEILDAEIRPSVAMDGGDITFDRFENGILYLQLLGSCAGCPSSTATLKDGIEARLQQEIPEIKEVVSV